MTGAFQGTFPALPGNSYLKEQRSISAWHLILGKLCARLTVN
jgi:hypothetical protein